MTDDTLRAALEAVQSLDPYDGRHTEDGDALVPQSAVLAILRAAPAASAPDEGRDRYGRNKVAVRRAAAEYARPAAPVALDVERLARAMRFVYDDPDLFGADVMDNATVPGAWTEIATALAREYAALSGEPTDDR